MTEPPDRLLLARALAGIGLPEPTRIAPVGRPWRHANWRVGFAPDAEQADVLVRIPVHPEVGDTLSPEVAALTALEGSGLPVVRQYARLRGLGRPAAVSEPLPGRTGEAVMRADPAQGALVTSAVGEVMRRLSEVRLQGFGTRAMGNRFVPMRPTWTEEWTARIAAFRTVVMASGIHLGSLSRALDEAIDARLGALSSVVDFSLVHGDLQPGNLLFEVGPDGPRLSGVIDWAGALAGDPFVDWALPLLVTDETLGHVVSGLGSEAVEQALAEPAAAARIELYHLTHLLHRLACAAGPHLRGDRSRQGAAVEQVRGMLHLGNT